jgi:hypothetical protein
MRKKNGNTALNEASSKTWSSGIEIGWIVINYQSKKCPLAKLQIKV